MPIVPCQLSTAPDHILPCRRWPPEDRGAQIWKCAENSRMTLTAPTIVFFVEAVNKKMPQARSNDFTTGFKVGPVFERVLVRRD